MNKKEIVDSLCLQEALQKSIAVSDNRCNFVACFICALLQVRTVNLVELAKAFDGSAKADSSYKRIQRFMREMNLSTLNLGLWLCRMLGLTGGLKLAVDRTEWKFGQIWINVLMVSVINRGVAIPLCWQILPQKGCASAGKHRLIMQRAVELLGVERIEYVTADREFGSRELISYLIEQKIRFRLRLKKNVLLSAAGQSQSIERWCLGQTKKVKVKVRGRVEIFGFRLFVQIKRLSEDEYLIVAASDQQTDLICDYKQRWQIETLFGCLKTRGFRLEETHLSRAERVENLLWLLAIALCWAIKTGEEAVKTKPVKRKKHGRAAKSLFRVGLDKLQEAFYKRHQPSKAKEFKELAELLSCT